MGRRKKEESSVVWTGMPNNQEAITAIKNVVDSCGQYLSEIDSAKESIEEAYAELKEEYKMPKRIFNALCKFNHYGTAEATLTKNQEVENAWEKFSNS